MKPRNVDLLLVIDASESMKPCFSQLRDHLLILLHPLQQANFKVRFGLLAYAAAPAPDGPVYDHTFIGGSGPEMIRKLYQTTPHSPDFFTPDHTIVARALADLEAQGNEDTLLALDIAADFPFGPVESTRRVIALFTDEPLEQGVAGEAPLRAIPDLVAKLMSRRIQLFVSAPMSPALEELGSLDQAEIEPVEGGDGLKKVNFSRLLAQMAKSISVSTLQTGTERPWKRAIYGQDQWTERRTLTASNRHIVLAVGESVRLDAAKPLSWLTIKLQWTAAVDLDLHAIYRNCRGHESSVYFGNREEDGIALDFDAGVGNVGGKNEENIRIESLDELEEILFATKIFNKGGCYADYNGRIIVETSNGEEVIVPLTSREHVDWCVIARFLNSPNGPVLMNMNAVSAAPPVLGDI
jgi:hypothetical protein